MSDYQLYSAILYDKQEEVKKHLGRSSPTVVIRTSKGIYVFSENIGKVYSNIVLAGAGRQCIVVTDWFRGQLSDLSLISSPRDPDARTDTPLLLPRVFYQHIDFSSDIVLADVVVIEIAAKEKDDYVARVDFLGGVEEIRDPVLILGHGNARDMVESGEDDEGDDSTHELAVEAEDERERLNKAFEEMGIHLPEKFNEKSEIESFIAELIKKYPGRKRFLNRMKLRSKQFQWIVEDL